MATVTASCRNERPRKAQARGPLKAQVCTVRQFTAWLRMWREAGKAAGL